MMDDLGLQIVADVANDPFFGRAGSMLAASQRESALKFELPRDGLERGAPDRDRLVQLSPRSPDGAVRDLGRRRRRRTPRASASASSASCSPCSPRTAWTPTAGRTTCASGSGNDPSPPDRRGDLPPEPAARRRPRGSRRTATSISGSSCCTRSSSTARPRLAFTLSVDFEGDQWQFFKFPLEDLRTLYGLDVAEMNRGAGSSTTSTNSSTMGRFLTAEVDSWYLPDTAGRVVRDRAREDLDRAEHDRPRRAGASATSTARATTSSRATTTPASSATTAI